MHPIHRRQFLKFIGAASVVGGARRVLADEGRLPQKALIAAGWRGPKPDDPYFAGLLEADWLSKKISIRHAVAIPSRPHGLLPEADGSLLVTAFRPGPWLMRLDAEGRVAQQLNIAEETPNHRFTGHVVVSRDGKQLFSAETDYTSGRGRIGVRDAVTLKKRDEWESHGLEPHQILLDDAGNLIVANGGIPRTLADKKYDLQRMDSSLVRLDTRSGVLMQQWKLDDPRLSLRHIAWSRAADGRPLLGVAMQAEHDDPARRIASPSLAVLDRERLGVPAGVQVGAGYAGDIAPAMQGGFVVSNNQTGKAQLWLPDQEAPMSTLVELKETYALTAWEGPANGGGVLVATGLGLVRWHSRAKPLFIPWPGPMALDNHWSLVSEV